MLNSKLTNCVECTTIDSLLAEIDCKLAAMAKDAYNNIVFMLNKKIDYNDVATLLTYKRVLMYKKFSSEDNYAKDFSVKDIASKVMLTPPFLNGKCCGCNNDVMLPFVYTTTSTTTSLTTTSSSTSSSSSSTTTTTTTTEVVPE